MDEVWRDIPFIENYQASTLGRIRSVEHFDAIGRLRKVRVLSGGLDTFGYRGVCLTVDGAEYTVTIHKLVMLTFVGPRPPGYDINHIDGDKTNNRPENLEYCTTSQNIQHSYDNGLQISLKGEANPQSKLTDDDVREIRQQIENGRKQTEIARDYSISPVTVTHIKQRKLWSHVK